MVEHRARLEQADLRTSSPMRESGSSAALQETTNGPQANSQSSLQTHSLPSLSAHGLPMPSNISKSNDLNTDSGVMYKIAAPPSGFTAVNGATPRYTSFRPDDSARTATKGSHATTTSEPQPTNHPGHSWRPQEDRSAAPRTHGESRTVSPNTKKRKIDEVDAVESREQQSRHTKSASELLSPPPEQNISRGPVNEPARESAPLTYGRVPSPVYRKDRGAPPPRAGPEISAALAESLKRSLEGADRTQRQDGTIDRSASPEEAPSNDRQTSEGNDDENEINLDGTKKRKRNFTHRTKTGCHTCRQRKKKCDETKPICMNCQRGTFECGGYGPKPPGGAKLSARQNTPIKPYEPSHGPTQFVYSVPPTATYEEVRRYVHPPADYPKSNHAPLAPPSEPPRPEQTRVEPPRAEPPRPHHYSQPPYPTEPRPPPPRESYGPPPCSRETYPRTYPEPPPHYAAERGLPPPIEHAGLAPLQIYPPHNLSPPAAPNWDPAHYRHPTHHTAPPPPASNPHGAPASRSHYTPSLSDHYTASVSDHSLNAKPTDAPHRRPGLTFLPNGSKTPRSKLLTGEAVQYFIDDSLLRDRISCKRALESYNDACTARSMASPGEQSRLFSTVLNPAARSNELWSGNGRWNGPQGSSGRRSVVLAPFRCEFGYNIHLGDNVVVDVGCYFQDAAEVWLGNGVVVGADCKFFTLDLKSGGKGTGGAAEGSQALFRAGAIRLEDDCVVEGNVTVLPFRTIGKGARVVAGSVVTKDVKPGTLVAGNPAKEVRAEDDRIVEEENSRMMVDMQNGWRGKGFGEG